MASLDFPSATMFFFVIEAVISIPGATSMITSVVTAPYGDNQRNVYIIESDCSINSREYLNNTI